MHLRDGIQTHPSVAQRYRHLVETGAVDHDAAQEKIAKALDRVIAETAARRLETKSSALGWLFARKHPKQEPVKGLYIHGGVGRGKTMLMDLFFELVPVRRKRRAHFNDFMADVQDRIQKHRLDRKNGATKEDDPIPPVARAIAEEARVLCFDEFTVTDIADAMVLSRLFSALFSQGVVLVATSNVAPDDLYRDGLNRQLFLPFVDILKRHTQVVVLESAKDYRQDRLNTLPVYLSPLDAQTARRMDEAWKALSAGFADGPAEIELKGRKILVPHAAGAAARFAFADLCARPLGARDFLAIAARFDTVMIDDVPMLSDAQRNEVKRFILLIDTLYDHRTRLIVSAAAEPDDLYTGGRGTEAFEYARTASRLTEMRSTEWLEAWRERYAPTTQSGQPAT